MKRLNIQLQPQRCVEEASKHVNDLVEVATAHDPDVVVDVEEGDDEGPYINVNIDSENVKLLWGELSTLITSDPSMASSIIACCEGDDRWNDYLLLHHFDETEPLDVLP